MEDAAKKIESQRARLESLSKRVSGWRGSLLSLVLSVA